MFSKEQTLTSEENEIPTGWKFDSVFKIFQAPFINFFFPWIVIILVIHRNNWKHSIIYILLFHYIFRAIGDTLRAFSHAYPVKKVSSTIWPYSKTRFYIGSIAALIFWMIGEIIGDWYPTVRACKIVHTKKKKYMLKISCILYNITKLMTIVIYFHFGKNMKFKEDTGVEDVKYFNSIMRYWWVMVIIISIFCLINDICVIYALQTEVFNKIKTLNGRTKGFVEMFKQVSELRIIISMIISIIFLVVIIPIIIIKFSESKVETKQVRNVFDQFNINLIREAVIYFNHTMMYIDQILLKYITTFPNKKNRVIKTESTTVANETVSDYSSATPY